MAEFPKKGELAGSIRGSAKRKVLFVSEHLKEDSHVSFLINAIAQDHEVLAFSYQSICTTFECIDVYQAIHQSIIEQHVDFIILNQGHWRPLDASRIKHLSAMRPIFAIFPDLEHSVELDAAALYAFDGVWVLGVSAYSIASQFNENVVYGQPIIPSQNLNQQTINKDIDITFFGGVNRADRREYICALKKYCKEKKKVFFLKDTSSSNPLPLREMQNHIARSKLSINFSKVVSEHSTFKFGVRHQFKGRVAESIVFGSTLVTEEFDGASLIFGDIDHFAFRDIDGMLAVVDRLLNDPALLDTVRKKQVTVIEAEFTVAAIAEKLKLLLSKRSTVSHPSNIHVAEAAVRYEKRVMETRFYILGALIFDCALRSSIGFVSSLLVARVVDWVQCTRVFLRGIKQNSQKQFANKNFAAQKANKPLDN